MFDMLKVNLLGTHTYTYQKHAHSMQFMNKFISLNFYDNFVDISQFYRFAKLISVIYTNYEKFH